MDVVQNLILTSRVLAAVNVMICQRGFLMLLANENTENLQSYTTLIFFLS